MADQKLTDKKFKLGSKELGEQIAVPVFKIENREKFKFEDKKSYIVNIEQDKEVLQREATFNGEKQIKYIVFVTIQKVQYFWEMSAKTLRQVEEALEESSKLNVQLDQTNKRYSIIPLLEE